MWMNVNESAWPSIDQYYVGFVNVNEIQWARPQFSERHKTKAQQMDVKAI